MVSSKKATWTTEDKDLITARPLPLKWVFAIDVVGAFLNANANDNVYFYMPQGFEEGKVLKLKKALYRLRQSPKLWYNTLASALHGLGFSPNTEE
jgi:hypothetical protein